MKLNYTDERVEDTKETLSYALFFIGLTLVVSYPFIWVGYYQDFPTFIGALIFAIVIVSFITVCTTLSIYRTWRK